MSLQHMVENRYFDWLEDYICKNKGHARYSYRSLLMTLHDIDFTYLISNDENRASDGKYLRYRFSLYFKETEGYDLPFLPSGPCSVLEMMLALAIRCEETIMDDALYGDRTAQWFWGMVSNLGIGIMTDDIFDEKFVRNRIDIFLKREYEPDGRGGLFYIRDSATDLRKVEIWAQLLWYLDNFA